MLYTSLRFEDLEFPAGLGWSDALNKRLTVKSFYTLAELLEVQPSDLADLVGYDSSKLKNKKSTLTRYQTDYLFKIALTYNRLKPVLKEHEEILSWMKTSRKEVRNQIPVLMLATEPGAFLVLEYIANMKPKQEKVSDVKEKDYDEEAELELDPDSSLNSSIQPEMDAEFDGEDLDSNSLSDIYR